MAGLSEFKKVDAYHRNEKISSSFYYPKISLINAFVNLDLIDFEDINLCPVCQKGGSIINRISGIEFMNQEMIKEDIFYTTAIGQAHIFISEKIKNLVNVEKFNNIKTLNVFRYKWNSLNP